MVNALGRDFPLAWIQNIGSPTQFKHFRCKTFLKYKFFLSILYFPLTTATRRVVRLSGVFFAFGVLMDFSEIYKIKLYRASLLECLMILLRLIIIMYLIY
jgi:hypothetical protein